MPQSQLIIGPQLASDGATPAQRGGRFGEIITSSLHGKYYEQCSRGNVFIGSTATGGLALLALATSGNNPLLWNPYGSGVNLSVIKLTLSYVSGTCSVGSVVWATVTPAGSTPATASPIATATQVLPVSALVGGGIKSKTLWAPAVNTFTTTAPVFLMSTGIALNAMASTSTNEPWVNTVESDGVLVVAPGNAITVGFSTTTTTALFQVAIMWEEIPV